MTPSLLEHPLIQEYFSCTAVNCDRKEIEPHRIKAEECMAYRILKAMCEPIKKGEGYLYWSSKGINEDIAYTGLEDVHHLNYLRLPDRFQPERELRKSCPHVKRCNCEWCCEHCAKPPSTAGAYTKSCLCGGGCDCPSATKPVKIEIQHNFWKQTVEHRSEAAKCGCLKGIEQCAKCHPEDHKPDPVEQRRKEIANEVFASNFRKSYAREWLEKQLIGLVALARRGK